MNNTRSAKSLLATLAGVALVTGAQAAPFVYTPEDVVLGIRETGTGANNNFQVNLGDIQRFRDSISTGNAITFSGVEFTFTQLFAAVGDLNNLRWSASATVRSDSGSAPLQTIWTTRARSAANSDGNRTTPWDRFNEGSQSGAASAMESVGQNAQAFAGGVNDSATQITIPLSSDQDYASAVGVNGNFINFQGNVEGSTGAAFDGRQRADFYELTPGSGPGTYLGYFELTGGANPNSFSFVPAPVPEPSTYASLALGGLLLVAVQRMRKNSAKA